MKKEAKTSIVGPFWRQLIMCYNIHMNDVVTSSLPELQDSDDESSGFDDEMMQYEEIYEDNVFEITVTDAAGNAKPFQLFNGLCLSQYISTFWLLQ
jgi:hypothetical protein